MPLCMPGSDPDRGNGGPSARHSLLRNEASLTSRPGAEQIDKSFLSGVRAMLVRARVIVALAFLVASSIAYGQAATKSYNQQIEDIIASVQRPSEIKAETSATKHAVGSTSSSGVLDITDADFGPNRRERHAPPPIIVQKQAPVAAEESGYVEQPEITPALKDRPKKATLRNVGFQYDESGRRIYEDGSITDQSGQEFYRYGSRVKYE